MKSTSRTRTRKRPLKHMPLTAAPNDLGRDIAPGCRWVSKAPSLDDLDNADA